MALSSSDPEEGPSEVPEASWGSHSVSSDDLDDAGVINTGK